MVKFTWFGHSHVCIEGSKVIIIDPWVTNNTQMVPGHNTLPTADIILLSSQHHQHGFDDACVIAKRDNNYLISFVDIANNARKAGVTKVISGNVGGTVRTDDGTEITLTQTVHAGMFSSIGFVFTLDGHTIYYTGDTGVFSDMKLIAELYSPDILILPIGGWYTMNHQGAIKAVEFVKPKSIIPVHYASIPPVERSALRFFELILQKFPQISCYVTKVGDPIIINDR